MSIPSKLEDLFTANVNDINVETSNKYWTIKPAVNPQSPQFGLFVVKTYNKYDSTEIANILNEPDFAIFDDYGNLFSYEKNQNKNKESTDTSYTIKKKFYNNLSVLPKSTPTDYEKSLMEEIPIKNISNTSRQTSNLNVPDERMTLNHALNYMLFKNNDGNYQLIYLPLHRKKFFGFYNQLTKNNFDNPNIQNLFQNYCLSVRNYPSNSNGDDQYHSDPTCNCFLYNFKNKNDKSTNPQLQQYPSAAVYTSEPTLVNFQAPVPASVYNALTNDGVGVCLATPCVYFNEKQKGDKDKDKEIGDFVTKYKNLKNNCEQSININVCQEFIDASGSIDISNSNFVNSCGAVAGDAKYYNCSGTKCVPGTKDNYQFDTLEDCLLQSKNGCGTGGGGKSKKTWIIIGTITGTLVIFYSIVFVFYKFFKNKK